MLAIAPMNIKPANFAHGLIGFGSTADAREEESEEKRTPLKVTLKKSLCRP